MKIVILNDMHPDDMPGAASVAFNFALEASKKHNVQFWCGFTESKTISKIDKIQLRLCKINVNSENRRNKYLGFKIIGEFLSINTLFWLFKNLIKEKPNVIWIHQIGNRFPRTIIPVARLLRIQVHITLHDFSSLIPRKLYPDDLGMRIDNADQGIASLLQHKEAEKILLNLDLKNKRFLLKLRLLLNRILTNFANEVICISELQTRILGSFKFNITKTIPNGVALCTCEEIGGLGRFKNSIMFAGRPNGKGFEKILDAVHANPKWHLHIAGPDRLLELALGALRPDRFTFYGKLSPKELFRVFHRVNIVSVISECFDVYPTVTLEAMRHNALVITTKVTGNSKLVSDFIPNLIIDYGEIPNLNKFEPMFEDKTYQKLIEFADANILSIEKSFRKYEF